MATTPAPTMTTNPVTSAASAGTSMMSSTPAVATSASGVTTMSSTAMETTTSATAGMETTTVGMTTTTTTTMGTTTTTIPPPSLKTVFVTSESFSGNLNGLEGGDVKCAEAAAAANLTGTFLSWLSNATHSPLTRFTPSLVPYVMIDGTKFADNFTSLLTDGPLNALSVNELNGTMGFAVLTGTNPNGTHAEPDCDGWTETNAQALTGSLQSKDVPDWTALVPIPCALSSPLYCFEQ